MTISWIDIKDELPPYEAFFVAIVNRYPKNEYGKSYICTVKRYNFFELKKIPYRQEDDEYKIFGETGSIYDDGPKFYSVKLIKAWARIDIPEKYK